MKDKGKKPGEDSKKVILVSKIARGKRVIGRRGTKLFFQPIILQIRFFNSQIPFFHYRKSENLTDYESKTGLLD